MQNNLINGLALFASANFTAYAASNLRNRFENHILKETASLLEVAGHLISHVFYADAYIDSFKHIIDGEIVAKFNNQLNIKEAYIAFPTTYVSKIIVDNVSNIFHLEINDDQLKYIKAFADLHLGEVMIDDISDIFDLNMSKNPYRYTIPYFAATGLKSLDQKDSTLFNVWKSFSSLPEDLPSPHVIGLISAISYNIINIPYLGEYIDDCSNDALTSIDNWKDNPGGDTYIGKFYRDYILYIWEKIHKPHHFYEEIEAIDAFRAGGNSPLMGEYEAVCKEFCF